MELTTGNIDRGLRLEFFKQEDRYAHRIVVMHDGLESPILTSREDSPANHWPISPPCQQLTMEQRGTNGSVALLIGMAGRSHWSISAAADNEAVAIDFDVACRANLAPQCLGSQYQVHGELQSFDNAIVNIAANNCLAILAITQDDAAVQWDGQTSRLTIAKAISKVNSPETYRWRYRVQWHHQ